MQSPKPKSILSYGTYYSIETALDFFMTGIIKYKNETYKITPHEWGPIVLFYNFIDTIETTYDKMKIKDILKYRIKDEHEHVKKEMEKLEDSKAKKLLENILAGITRKTILKLVKEEGIEIVERPFTVIEAKSAKEAFFTSSTALIKPVISIDNVSIGNGNSGLMTCALIDKYFEFMENLTENS